MNKRSGVVEILREIRRILKEDSEVFCDFRTQDDDMYCNAKEYGEFIAENTILMKKM